MFALLALVHRFVGRRYGPTESVLKPALSGAIAVGG